MVRTLKESPSKNTITRDQLKVGDIFTLKSIGVGDVEDKLDATPKNFYSQIKKINGNTVTYALDKNQFKNDKGDNTVNITNITAVLRDGTMYEVVDSKNEDLDTDLEFSEDDIISEEDECNECDEKDLTESTDLDGAWYEFVKSKTIEDEDGFATDYTMYETIGFDGDGDEIDFYIFIYGDNDIYDPTNTSPDWSTNSKEEAEEWFSNYDGSSSDAEGIDEFESKKRGTNMVIVSEGKKLNEDSVLASEYRKSAKSRIDRSIKLLQNSLSLLKSSDSNKQILQNLAFIQNELSAASDDVRKASNGTDDDFFEGKEIVSESFYDDEDEDDEDEFESFEGEVILVPDPEGDDADEVLDAYNICKNYEGDESLFCELVNARFSDDINVYGIWFHSGDNTISVSYECNEPGFDTDDAMAEVIRAINDLDDYT